jgi:hypothetical protein
MEMMGIDWVSGRNSSYDEIMGRSSGGGAIFGVTGGVTEAAVRYAHEVITRTKLDYQFPNCLPQSLSNCMAVVIFQLWIRHYGHTDLKWPV